MTKNKFGWKAGDGLRWSSPEGCDKSCVVTKATAKMIEFETEEGEVKRVKGNNPSISRIDDSPPKAESISMPEAKAAVEAEPEQEPEMEPESSAETSTNTKPEKAGECAPIDEVALISAGAEEKISKRRAEVDLKSGGVVEISIQLREGGALRAGDQEFRLANSGEGEWHPSLEEALDAEYGGRWMCIRWRDG